MRLHSNIAFTNFNFQEFHLWRGNNHLSSKEHQTIILAHSNKLLQMLKMLYYIFGENQNIININKNEMLTFCKTLLFVLLKFIKNLGQTHWHDIPFKMPMRGNKSDFVSIYFINNLELPKTNFEIIFRKYLSIF